MAATMQVTYEQHMALSLILLSRVSQCNLTKTQKGTFRERLLIHGKIAMLIY